MGIKTIFFIGKSDNATKPHWHRPLQVPTGIKPERKMGRKKIRVKRRSARGGKIRGKELIFKLEEDESGVILSTERGK